MKNRVINIRLEQTLKEDVEKVFDQLSITTSAAIQLFLQQVVIQQRIPFDVKVNKAKKDNGA